MNTTILHIPKWSRCGRIDPNRPKQDHADLLVKLYPTSRDHTRPPSRLRSYLKSAIWEWGLKAFIIPHVKILDSGWSRAMD